MMHQQHSHCRRLRQVGMPLMIMVQTMGGWQEKIEVLRRSVNMPMSCPERPELCDQSAA